MLATLNSPVDADVGVTNFIPTSLITDFQTLIFTMAFSLVSVNVPISDPCIDSTPAKGCPPIRAVNFATVEEVFTPAGSGFAIISKGGFVSFSKTVQVQSVPKPPVSKLIGLF